MDPELPFFCHTLNERFSTDLLPSFDEAPIGCNENGGDNDDETDSRNPFRLHRLIRNTRKIFLASKKQGVDQATISPFRYRFAPTFVILYFLDQTPGPE